MKRFWATLYTILFTVCEWLLMYYGGFNNHQGWGNVLIAWAVTSPILDVIILIGLCALYENRIKDYVKLVEMQSKFIESRPYLPNSFFFVSDALLSIGMIYLGWFWCGGLFILGTLISCISRSVKDDILNYKKL